MTVLTSAIATTGRNRQNSRNSVKNNPKLPISIRMSMIVGLKSHQLDGRKSRDSDVTMITKRSNHMPMLAKNAAMKTTSRLVRIDLNHRICGATALQKIITQNAQPYQPKARFQNANFSYSCPLYQAVKNSVP